MKSLHVRSYAKINLCLNITGKREDGFHELDIYVTHLFTRLISD